MDAISSPSSPPLEEPEPKKLKMSTTTTISDDEATTNLTSTEERKPRYKRRKVAIFFAYCGVGYQGMQKNPGAKTIEGDLEEALYQSGAVPEPERGNHKRWDFARSARTDKGVSAVGQVVSGRFYVDPPGFVDRLNSNLPNQIRVFGFKRVTNSFSAKKFCDRRRYIYMIPVFALDPNAHPDRESVLASLGSENELVKCLTCPEIGRKVFGVMGKRKIPDVVDVVDVVDGVSVVVSQLETVSESGFSPDNNNGGGVVVSQLETVSESGFSPGNNNGGSGGVVSQIETVSESGFSPDNNNGGVVVSNTDTTSLESKVSEEVEPNTVQCSNGVETLEKKSGFCYGEKEKEKFNRILSHYVGTHNFHNFTTRIKAEDPSAKRFIVSFDANSVVSVEGMDFVKCQVVGQSFMLHQIRKMIGLAVAIMRNTAPEELIDAALQRDVNINVPTAPEVGLFLEECFFTSYNQKWNDTHEEISMKDYMEAAEDFKMKQVYSHISLTEQKEGYVGIWLHSLNPRNYPDLRYLDSKKTCLNGENAEVQSVANGESAQVESAVNGESAEAESAPNEKSAQVESTSNGENAQVESVPNGENAQVESIG